VFLLPPTQSHGDVSIQDISLLVGGATLLVGLPVVEKLPESENNTDALPSLNSWDSADKYLQNLKLGD